MKIGLIGYGELGSRLGKRLMQSGYTVYGFDICKKAMGMIKEDGAIPLSSPFNIAEKCKIIITCVNDDFSVEQCILDKSGVIHGIKSDAIVIEMTTSTPTMTKKIGEALRKTGAEIIDAPVSRGIPAAENGTLSILVGGKKEIVGRCRPILETLGTDIIYCGDLGAGHAVKAINMMMMACNLLATTEVITLGLKRGVNLKQMLNVINGSSGENYMTSHHFPKYVASNSFQSKFSLGLMNKDLNIAIKMADNMGIVSLMGKRSTHLYNLLISRIPLNEDNMQSIKEIQSLMGGYTNRLHTGVINRGHLINSLNNLLSATNSITAVEGLSMAKMAGVDPTIFTKAINASSGQSYITNIHFEQYYLPRRFISNLTIEKVYKDLSNTLELARKQAVPMMFNSLTQEIYSIAMCKGMAKEDNTRIMEVIEDLIGINTLCNS